MNGILPLKIDEKDGTYLVEDVFDFIAIGKIDSKEELTFKVVAEIDFNNHPDYKFGFNNNSNNANLIYKEKFTLIGDGNEKHKIRNIYVKDGFTSSYDILFTFKSIKNLIFENMVVAISDKLYTTTYSGGPGVFRCMDGFYDCSFSIYSMDSQPFSLFNHESQKMSSIAYNRTYHTSNFINCSFNIYGTTIIKKTSYMNSILLNNLYFCRCHINFNNFRLNNWYTYSTSTVYSFALFTGINTDIEFTYFTGNIILNKSNLSKVPTGFMFPPIISNNNTLNNSYFALTLENFKNNEIFKEDKSIFSIEKLSSSLAINTKGSNFIDKDLLFKECKEDTIYTDLPKLYDDGTQNHYLYCFTTEECKTNSELVNVSFPVIELNNENE